MKKSKPDFRQRDVDENAEEKATDRIKRLFEHLKAQNLILTPSTKIEIEKFADLFDEVGADAILIVGDTGVGKTLFLKVFEFLYVDRNGKREIPEINCAHLRSELSASTLFGYVKGAFTGAAQDRAGFIEKHNNGPIILEEIGVLNPDVQAQLLTVMESRKFYRVGDANTIRYADIQLIGATNDEEALRKDFRYRFHPFYLTPLYKRREDVLWFIWNMDKDFFRSLHTWEILILMCYNWPGNIRELRRIIRTLKLLRKWYSNKLIDNIFTHYDLRISSLRYSANLYNSVLSMPVNINDLDEHLNRYNIGIIPVNERQSKLAVPFKNIYTDKDVCEAIINTQKGLLTFTHLFRTDPYGNNDISDIWKAQLEQPFIIREHYTHFNEIPSELKKSIWSHIRAQFDNRLREKALEGGGGNVDGDGTPLKSEASFESQDMFSLKFHELKKAYIEELLKRTGGNQRKAASLAGVNAKTFSTWCRKDKVS